MSLKEYGPPLTLNAIRAVANGGHDKFEAPINNVRARQLLADVEREHVALTAEFSASIASAARYVTVLTAQLRDTEECLTEARLALKEDGELQAQVAVLTTTLDKVRATLHVYSECDCCADVRAALATAEAPDQGGKDSDFETSYVQAVAEIDRLTATLEKVRVWKREWHPAGHENLEDILSDASRRCAFCKGHYPVSDAVAEENPFCASCLDERVTLRRQGLYPALAAAGAPDAGEAKHHGTECDYLYCTTDHTTSEQHQRRASGGTFVATMGGLCTPPEPKGSPRRIERLPPRTLSPEELVPVEAEPKGSEQDTGNPCWVDLAAANARIAELQASSAAGWAIAKARVEALNAATARAEKAEAMSVQARMLLKEDEQMQTLLDAATARADGLHAATVRAEIALDAANARADAAERKLASMESSNE